MMLNYRGGSVSLINEIYRIYITESICDANNDLKCNDMMNAMMWKSNNYDRECDGNV